MDPPFNIFSTKQKTWIPDQVRNDKNLPFTFSTLVIPSRIHLQYIERNRDGIYPDTFTQETLPHQHHRLHLTIPTRLRPGYCFHPSHSRGCCIVLWIAFDLTFILFNHFNQQRRGCPVRIFHRLYG